MSATSLTMDSIDPGVKLGDSSRSPVAFSATVSTSEGWPGIKEALLTVARSVELAGGELIVTDGSGHPPPTHDDLGTPIRWFSHPGESVFELRRRAYDEARGEIVAITEDHVHEARRTHRRLGGAIDHRAADGTGFRAGAVNVSYKRPAIEKMRTFYGNGAIDLFHQMDLAERGDLMLIDDSIRVSHVQDLGIAGMTELNFHAGRSVAGLRPDLGVLARLIRIAATPVLPLVRYVRRAIGLTPRGYGRALGRATPALLLLLYANCVGEFMGYLFGPGDSPRKLA